MTKRFFRKFTECTLATKLNLVWLAVLVIVVVAFIAVYFTVLARDSLRLEGRVVLTTDPDLSSDSDHLSSSLAATNDAAAAATVVL